MHMRGFNVFMRTRAKYALAAICVVLMVVWFVPFDRLMSPTRTAGGTVFGRTVTGTQVDMVARTLQVLVASRNMDVKRLFALAWETLILDMEAERYGLRASDQQIEETLKNLVPMRTGMEFSDQAYMEFLRMHNLSRREFEEGLRTFLTSRLLQDLVGQMVTLPAEEAWMWYSREQEQVQAAYARINAQDLMPLIANDEKQVAAFYDKYKDVSPKEDPNGIGYQEPKKIKIEYILARYDQYTKLPVISEQQVTSYYESNKDRLYRAAPKPDAKPTDAPAYRPLSDVAAQIEDRLRREEAERIAAEVIKEVNQEVQRLSDPGFGEEARTVDLAAVAAQFKLQYVKTDKFFSSDETESVLPGASYGLSEAFRRSGASVGRGSWVIQSADGRLVYQMIAVQEPRPYPFETVRQDVERDWKRQQALTLASELASAAAKGATKLEDAAARLETLLAERIKGAPASPELKPDAKAYFTSGRTQYFTRPTERGGSRDSYSTGIPGNHGDLAYTAFALKDNEVGTVTEGGRVNSVFLLARIDTKEADREAFEKDKAQIVQQYLQRKQMAEAKTWMADVRRRAAPSAEAMKYLKELPTWSGQQEEFD